MSAVPELGSWLAFFRSRRDRVIDLPWSEEIPPERHECSLIARSIATFQLGESSDGAHLIAAAREFGRARSLPAIGEVTELFIREEQGHAALLAAFMKANEIPLRRSDWSDRVFRRLRHLAGFELAVSVLIVAELIALTYYRALAAATRSLVLRDICETIVADELSHVAYESTLLLRLRESRGRLVQRAARGLHALLYAGAVAVVFTGHRAVLRAGGFGPSRFWRACWDSWSHFLARTARPQAA
jgi:hypothetical protein